MPPGRTEDFTPVEIQPFPGRSVQARKALFQAIVQRVEAIGIAHREVFIVLNEPALENRGIRGRVPASEMNRGFRLDV